MAVKNEIKKSQTRGKRKTNLLKLCTVMNKLSVDAVDKEVVRRFRTVIDSAEEDISKTQLQNILQNPEELQLTAIPEIFHPYIKHYLFMKKREAKKSKDVKKANSIQ